MMMEKQLQDELVAPCICNTQDSTSQASASSSSLTQTKIYCMVLSVPSDNKQSQQLGEDTFTREHMKTEKDSGETQGLMTDDDVRKFLEVLTDSKQDKISEVSWKSSVDLFGQAWKLMLEREKLVINENAHLKKEIAAERKIICFLQDELKRSQELVSEMLRKILQNEGEVKIDATKSSFDDSVKEAEMTKKTESVRQISAEEMCDPTADMSDDSVRTMKQTQYARHDADLGSGVCQTATPVNGTSAASSSSMPSALPSKTPFSLEKTKMVFAEAAVTAVHKAGQKLEETISACQKTQWLGQIQGVSNLKKATRLLTDEEPGTWQAAEAHKRVEDTRRLDSLPADIAAVLKTTARAVRDVLVLRTCWLIDHRSRDAFLNELKKAFNHPIKGELESQLLHAYNTLTSAEDGLDIPGAFTSRNEMQRRRGPRRKETTAAAEEMKHKRIVQQCVESVLTMEPMKVILQIGEPGQNASSVLQR